MNWHQLKIRADAWDAVNDGSKRAELRVNDRDYQRGDILELGRLIVHGTPEEQAANDAKPFGHAVNKTQLVRVTHVHHGSDFGLTAENVVMLSIEHVRIVAVNA